MTLLKVTSKTRRESEVELKVKAKTIGQKPLDKSTFRVPYCVTKDRLVFVTAEQPVTEVSEDKNVENKAYQTCAPPTHN